MTLVLLDDDAQAQVVSRVPEGVAAEEHPLRDLIHDHPALLPLRELEPGIGRVATVAKELNLPGAGFIDVLLVSEHGRLIVVECKLWRNPQARREVVGQVLDYARELARYGYEDLQRTVSNRLRRTGNVLFEVARDAGSEMSETAFVDRVTRDLRAGRFLLLIVGDGITEGTQRIGDYLGGQAGLAFDLGLVEMAEYRFDDPATGTSRRIMQPRLLARTAVIERHVIRNDVVGIRIDEVETPATTTPSRTSAAASEAYAPWRAFAQHFIGQMRFDDPAQLPPRIGGMNWLRVPLPAGASITLWRSSRNQIIGAAVSFTTADGIVLYHALAGERDAIDAEFVRDGLTCPAWDEREGECSMRISSPAPLPWTGAGDEAQQRWMALAANRFVNSLRPRLLRIDDAA